MSFKMQSPNKWLDHIDIGHEILRFQEDVECHSVANRRHLGALWRFLRVWIYFSFHSKQCQLFVSLVPLGSLMASQKLGALEVVLMRTNACYATDTNACTCIVCTKDVGNTRKVGEHLHLRNTLTCKKGQLYNLERDTLYTNLWKVGGYVLHVSPPPRFLRMNDDNNARQT